MIILCKTLLKGGAEKQSLILARLLTHDSYNVHLVNWCGHKADPDHLATIQNSSIKYTGLKGNPIKKFLALRVIVKQEKNPIILAYLTLANLISGILGILDRNVITIGGIRTEQFPLYKFLFEKFVHNHLNTATVFNNYSAKEKFIKKGFKPGKIFVIHNAIIKYPQSEKKKTDREITLITVSRFVKSKDFNTSLLSFSRIRDMNPAKDLRYIIAGYGRQESAIRALIGRYNLGDSVDVMINPGNIRELLNSSDIFLSTSLFEGLSNSLMEAMVAGLPIVATNVGDNKYLVEQAVNGYLVSPRDSKTIADRIDALVNSEGQRLEMGQNSRRKVENEYSEEQLLENYKKLFSMVSPLGGLISG